MIRSLSAIALLVPSYDEGLAFFVGALGFTVQEDVPLVGEKRWVVVSPSCGGGTAIVLAAPATSGSARESAIRRAGGSVIFFSPTTSRKTMPRCARGATFLETPRNERYGTVAVFVVPWGGKWDLLQPAGVSGEQASSGP